MELIKLLDDDFSLSEAKSIEDLELGFGGQVESDEDDD